MSGRKRQLAFVILYATLALVVISEARTVFLAMFEPERFLRALPGVARAWLPVIIATSAAAGIAAILVGARVRWAVWLNLAIGLWSILLLNLVRAPATNSAIVSAACTISVGVPLLTWMRDPVSAVSAR
jgi:hypothetical protein